MADDWLEVLNTCIQDLDPNGDFNDPSNISTDPLFTSLANDNYLLVSTGCSGDDCQSDAIDAGDNADVECEGVDGVDLFLEERCIELENHGEITDMGCLESQE